MKRATKVLGYYPPGFHLKEILCRSLGEFAAAEKRFSLAEKVFFENPDEKKAIEWSAAIDARTESAVVAILTAGAWLEESLFSYAIRFIDDEWYEIHLNRLGVVTKWLMIPRICEGKVIDEQSAAISDLKQLVRVRNAITHPKTKLLRRALNPVEEKWEKEWNVTLEVTRKLKRTVDRLELLLK